MGIDVKKYKLGLGNSCDALPDFVPFVQFKKREKHSWKSVTFSKVAGRRPLPVSLLKVTFLHACFSRFSNCKNDIKSRVELV